MICAGLCEPKTCLEGGMRGGWLGVREVLVKGEVCFKSRKQKAGRVDDMGGRARLAK